MMRKEEVDAARARANLATATWKGAAAEAAAAGAAYVTAKSECAYAPSLDTRLALLELEIAKLCAEDNSRERLVAATDAADAADLAAGDELASACALRILHDDLIALLDAEDRLRDAFSAAKRATLRRASQARFSRERLAERRRIAGLPPPAILPDPIVEGIEDRRPRVLLKELAKRLVSGHAMRESNASRLQKLRTEETELRANRERARREREKAALEAVRFREREKRTREGAAMAQRKEHELIEAANAAKIVEQRDLAAADRSRSDA